MRKGWSSEPKSQVLAGAWALVGETEALAGEQEKAEREEGGEESGGGAALFHPTTVSLRR